MGFFDANGYNLTTGTQNISDPLPPPMAYSRYRRRRSFRRRPARTLRRSQHKRTVRRRRFVRRPRRRMTSRRVRNIASRKKHDTQLGASSSGANPVQLHAGNNYYLWSPSYLEQQDESYDYVRNAQNVFFRGVQDRVFLSAAFAFTWRRVCFFSYEQLVAGIPFFVDPPNEDDPHIVRRPLREINPKNASDFFAYAWKGTVGVDFSENTRWNAPLDDKLLTIVYDRSCTINPNYAAPQGATFGKSMTRKMWHPVNKTIMYTDKENGSTPQTTGWSSMSPNSPGNFYILDIFSTGQDLPGDTTGVGEFGSEATVYWHEN